MRDIQYDLKQMYLKNFEQLADNIINPLTPFMQQNQKYKISI